MSSAARTAKRSRTARPKPIRGTTSWLFRNRRQRHVRGRDGDGRVSSTRRRSRSASRMLDYDLDGWPDLFVANDTQPNKLYRNNRNGTFAELGLQAGLAFSEDGRARAGMGADAADFDNSGVPSVAVTNFSGEMLGLYMPVGKGVYADRAPASDIGRATRLTLGFGCFFFDADLDGLQDLLVVNGHIDESASRRGARPLRGIAAPVPQSRQRHVRRRRAGHRHRFRQAEGGTRRRVRRLRPRRRPRRRHHHQRRTGAPLSQRSCQRQPQRPHHASRRRGRIATASAPGCVRESDRRGSRGSSGPARAISRSPSCR